MTHHDFQHDFSVQSAELLEQLLAGAESCAPDQSPTACFLTEFNQSETAASHLFGEPRDRTECQWPAVTIGLPWLKYECSLRWCGLRFFWWPRGVPEFHRCAILSSRLERPYCDQKSWFADLRNSIAELNASRDCLIVDSSVWTSRVVERAAELARVKVLKFCETSQRKTCSIDTATMAEWLAQRLRSLRNHDQNSTANNGSDVWSVDVSPVLSRGLSLSLNDSEMEFRPLADRLLFASAQTIRVLHCREGGHTDALIHHHLLDPDRRNVPVFFGTAQATSETKENQEPQNHRNRANGARAGRESLRDHANATVRGRSETLLDDKNEMMTISAAVVRASDDSCPLRVPENWLLHWTRACDGPWPDQSEKDWMDELINGSPFADHSAFATLKRIVEQERLIASSSGIRGKHQVVCFTEVPLTEFCSRKTFRRHRRRHDFEPWGVAVCRSALMELGARPVLYGDESLWKTLSASDRPWFQRECSGADTNRPGKISVWANEKEWRIAGDLNLRQFRQSDVCWFVRDAESSRQLSERTNRRVIVVPRNE